jgi:hypothetical protein
VPALERELATEPASGSVWGRPDRVGKATAREQGLATASAEAPVPAFARALSPGPLPR